ncbi:MAG: hypothetical protein GX343_00175 [Erysipelotrichaceae bacterium]|jgi:hypothetical protein|nr:hypothetical protein [Bacillota bacterium]MDY0118856.1 hypothetical protein [Bacilli bacterium]NLJ32241.1 hypothetical protein [Erysipelotrichaceae bacterium]
MSRLSNLELSNVVGGEAITLGAVMAILAIAIVSVIIYKLFLSETGKAQLPGGYKFEWK